MSTAKAVKPRHLTVLIPGRPSRTVRSRRQGPKARTRPSRALAVGVSSLVPDFPEENLIEGFGDRWRWLMEPAEIPLRRVKNEITRVEQEVDAWLAGLKPTTSTGFDLTQVQVLVGMSAQGSIAVVTAGLQASLTLVYTRRGAHP